MSDEQLKVDGKERVALELMRTIAAAEKSPERDSNPREYYLKLYEQAIAVVRGANAEFMLKGS